MKRYEYMTFDHRLQNWLELLNTFGRDGWLAIESNGDNLLLVREIKEKAGIVGSVNKE